MDNLTDGLHIAVSILIFIIAVSLTMYLFSQLTSTAEIVYEIALQPGYYSEIEIDRDENTELGSKRIVGKNDIITALYRYPIQTVAITILDVNGKEYQVFDKYIESQVRTLSSVNNSTLKEIDKEFLKKFDTKHENLYLFGAPWIGSTQAHRERVDLFVNSENGFINGKPVNYGGKGLKNLNNEKFIETVLNYKISGEGLYDNLTGIEVVTSESGTYKTEIIYQATE